MICGTCGEEWFLDSIHDSITEKHGDEIDALRAKYANHPLRYKGGDPFQADYERLFFNPALEDFRKRGCKSIDSGASWCVPDEQTANRSAVVDAAFDLMGDDVDGIGVMLEDAERTGLL